MFTDKIEIEVKAGRGGDGRMSFRHEKGRARGGPDGGDGGRGGSVIFRVDHNLHTLAAFRKARLVKAEHGAAGGSDRRHGKAGEDTIIKVPMGTQVFEDGEITVDLTHDGEEVVIARGGRGGFGNAHFTSSTRQAPRAMELGEAGIQKSLTLELKLVADVGLVGLPNAGKSTLLSVISNAKPEIGDYPFTTLTPNLGVVDYENYTFLVADIPDLIEGASKGKGLGDEFLRHIERTAVILHLIDSFSDDVVRDYKTIQSELREYTVDLSAKPQIVVLTKTESVTPEQQKAQKAALKKASKGEVLSISAVAQQGITAMLKAVVPAVEAARVQQAEDDTQAAIPVIDESTQPNLWQLTREGKKTYVLSGEALEGFARRTDWSNDESVDRIRDILRKRGIDREMKKLGAEPGSTIKINEHSVEWLG